MREPPRAQHGETAGERLPYAATLAALWKNRAYMRNAIIGQGLAPLSVGMFSDYLMPSLGVESLRCALAASVIYTLLCGLAFIVAEQRTRAMFSAKAQIFSRPLSSIA